MTSMEYALAALANSSINFSITWFIAYALLGSLVKVGLIRLMNKDLEPRSRRFWPVFLSHFLFSIIFVHLFTLFAIDRLLSNKMSFLPFFPCLLSYFTVLPVLLDTLFLRVFPRIKLFSWLLWTPPLKQVIIINVVICLVSFIAAGWVARVL